MILFIASDVAMKHVSLYIMFGFNSKNS